MSEFKIFKKAMQDRFTMFVSQNRPLFISKTEGNFLFDLYLDSFPEDQRQGYNCNCCKSFIRHYGIIVTVNPETYAIETLWDIETGVPEFDHVAKEMNTLVSSYGIRDRFYMDVKNLGTDSNIAVLENGETVTWNHFYFKLPAAYVSTTSYNNSLDAMRSVARDKRNVLKRGLDEFTLDTVDTVLDLIQQGSVYRGTEFVNMLNQFHVLKKAYNAVPDQVKEAYVWLASTSVHEAVAKIRNASIGTFLIDVQEGKDLTVAVDTFGRLMDPTNYKRPKTIVSKKMIEDAEKKVTELGLLESLPRRFATPDDIRANNVLFINRDSKKETGIFGDLKETVTVSPKKFDKLEEVTIEQFVSQILPKVTMVEALLENKHTGNLVSLIAPQNPDAPSLFKWDNGFSWCYRNAVADSMKERVKEAGGKIDGVLRYTIMWNEDGHSIADLDAHAYEPTPMGEHIYYANHCGRSSSSQTRFSGVLDVDMRSPRTVGVENIVWHDLSRMKHGKYRFTIHNFNGGRISGFRAEIEFNGEIYSFEHSGHLSGTMEIAEVMYSTDGFKLVPKLPASTNVTSKEIWKLNTNQFQKVSMILNSPNHWDGQQKGNKHVFFMLDGAHNDEAVRGFFNEFLPDSLLEHKRVFESLGGRMQVLPADKQLSGLGFSDTLRNELVVKVSGSFTRMLKIKF